MKLIEDNEVILGSAGNTSKFKIAASAKAFKIQIKAAEKIPGGHKNAYD